MTKISRPPFEVLLAEDNPGDAYLVREAFREAGTVLNLHHVKDGVEAMEYLRRKGTHANALLPDLILLDLNMPRMNGLEVLKAIKNDEHLCLIPVIILTTSEGEFDIDACYAQHANGYISKPVGFREFVEAIQSIEQFWLKFAKLLRG